MKKNIQKKKRSKHGTREGKIKLLSTEGVWH